MTQKTLHVPVLVLCSLIAAIFNHPMSHPSIIRSMKGDKELVILNQASKPRKSGSREVSSSFSPNRRKPSSNSTNIRKTLSLLQSGSIRGQLWPSSSSPAANSSAVKKNNLNNTLADHFGNDKLREYLDYNDEKSAKSSSIFAFTRQRSCSETLNRFENDKTLSKDIGRNSMSSRKSGIEVYMNNISTRPRKLTLNSNTLTLDNSSVLWPASSSSSPAANSSNVKKNNFNNTLADHLGNDRLREYLDYNEEKSATCSSVFALNRQRSCLETLSRFENDKTLFKENHPPNTAGKFNFSGKSLLSSSSVTPVPRRLCVDENVLYRKSSLDNSSVLKKFTIKNAIRRANSLTDHKSSKSQWALSPGRSGLPPMSVESREQVMSFSSLKPPTSPSKAKGVAKLLNMGLDCFKGMKSSTNSSSPRGIISSGSDDFHNLRLLDNRLLQWRYANARAEAVKQSNTNQAESNLLCAWGSLTKLRHSVLQKKIQYEKEKLEMKLNLILYSQIKLLEAWADMERQHVSAITVTKESLHSVVCRVPLLKGAKVDIQSTDLGLQQASVLIASIQSMLNSILPSAVETASLLSELAEVVAEEKFLIEVFYDLLQTMSTLEIQESSLKCSLIQFNCWQQQYQRLQLLQEISS